MPAGVDCPVQIEECYLVNRVRYLGFKLSSQDLRYGPSLWRSFGTIWVFWWRRRASRPRGFSEVTG